MRQSCIQCACKHIAKSRTILNEWKNGYKTDDFFDYCLGELACAEDELVAEFPAFAAAVRQERKSLESDPFHEVPFGALLLTIRKASGYSLSGIVKIRGGFMSKVRKFFAALGFVLVAASVHAAGITITHPEIDKTARADVTVVSNLLGNYATPENVSNVLAGIASTGSYYSANFADSLVSGDGWGSFSISNGVLNVVTWTNTPNVAVAYTNGSGYNGPAIGTVYTYIELSGSIHTWSGYLTASDIDGSLFTATAFSLIPDVDMNWVGSPAVVGLPVSMYPFPGSTAVGTLKLSWVTSATTNVYDLSQYAAIDHTHSDFTTNHVVAVGDTFHITNGILMNITPAP